MKIIKLNVGGTKYQTTYDTLVMEPLSRLALMVHHAERDEVRDVETLEEKMAEDGAEVEETKKTETQEDSEIFVDRNGQLFEFVLEYLRNPNAVRLPNDSHLILKRLLVEAEFFQLEGLKREVEFALNTYPFAVGDTVRLRPDVVGRWINNVVDKSNPTQFLYACGLEHMEQGMISLMTSSSEMFRHKMKKMNRRIIPMGSPLPQVEALIASLAGGLEVCGLRYRSTSDLRGPLTRSASPPLNWRSKPLTCSIVDLNLRNDLNEASSCTNTLMTSLMNCPVESSWNPFRKKTPTEMFWSLFSNKRSPAEVYAWRGRITDFVERPNPDYAVVRFRLPQYSKKKEDPDYVDLDLRAQIGMMVKVK